MEPDQFKELLARYADGTANEDEKRLIEDWYADYDDEAAMQQFSASGKAEAIKAEMETTILSKRNNYSFWRTKIKNYYRYAAILALILPAIFFTRHFFQPEKTLKTTSQIFNTVKTGPGEYKKVTLADSSMIQMNPNSKIRIPGDFVLASSGKMLYKNRTVFLDEGEAFFEVTKDPNHPFIVYTNHIKTRVLGTKFAVNSMADAITEVSVSEGKVEVSDNKKILDYLLPGKKLSYNSKTKNWKVKDFATREHNNWCEQVVDLDHATFKRLAEVMKTNYGIILKGNSRVTAAYLYNLQIRSARSLDQTMKIICSVHQNKYRRIGNEIVIY